MSFRREFLILAGLLVLGGAFVGAIHVLFGERPVRLVDRGEAARLGDLDAIAPLLDEYCDRRWGPRRVEGIVMAGCTVDVHGVAGAHQPVHRTIGLSTGRVEDGDERNVRRMKVAFEWEDNRCFPEVRVCDERISILKRFARAFWPSHPDRAQLERELSDPDRSAGWIKIGKVSLDWLGTPVRHDTDSDFRRCWIELRASHGSEPEWSIMHRRIDATLRRTAKIDDEPPVGDRGNSGRQILPMSVPPVAEGISPDCSAQVRRGDAAVAWAVARHLWWSVTDPTRLKKFEQPAERTIGDTIALLTRLLPSVEPGDCTWSVAVQVLPYATDLASAPEDPARELSIEVDKLRRAIDEVRPRVAAVDLGGSVELGRADREAILARVTGWLRDAEQHASDVSAAVREFVSLSPIIRAAGQHVWVRGFAADDETLAEISSPIQRLHRSARHAGTSQYESRLLNVFESLDFITRMWGQNPLRLERSYCNCDPGFAWSEGRGCVEGSR